MALELLPESLVESCIELLRKSTSSERELVRVVVEIIEELRCGVVVSLTVNVQPSY